MSTWKHIFIFWAVILTFAEADKMAKNIDISLFKEADHTVEKLIDAKKLIDAGLEIAGAKHYVDKMASIVCLANFRR